MRAALTALLLAVSLPLAAADPNQLTVTAADATDLDPSGHVVMHYSVENPSRNDAQVVTAFIMFPAWFLTAHGADCTNPKDFEVRCTLPPIPAGGRIDFDLVGKPVAVGGRWSTSIEVLRHDFGITSYAHGMLTLYAPFVVTTTADDGPGSLRAAIVATNAAGVPNYPCRISFAIAEPPGAFGWYRIEPQSPLPPIEGWEIVVDGKYRNEVPIEIRGSRAFGDGLVVRGAYVTLNGLSIDGNWANGVVVDQKVLTSGTRITNNVIGSDPTGAAVPNGLRGIVTVRGGAAISGNIISGNTRSGIFLTADDDCEITGNKITNNGASGIYVGPMRAEIEIAGNVISGNRDFPVGTDANVVRVAVRDNAMFDNGAPFDIGMNGPGAKSPDPYVDLPVPPTITSAVYDVASGDTVITMAFTPVRYANDTNTLYIFANHALDRAGRVEAETFLGTSVTTSVVPQTIVFRTHADLRGQLITALTVRTVPWEYVFHTSSELSEGVGVE